MGPRQDIWYKIINDKRLHLILSSEKLNWEDQFPFKVLYDKMISVTINGCGWGSK